MATIRPNAEPAATVVAGGDIFLIDGATGVRALAATSVAVRDANGNIAINNVVEGYATTATAASTTTLDVTSKRQQFFTGTTTQTVTLPVTSTLALGYKFFFKNNSTGAVTIQSSGANNVVVLAPGASALVKCILLTGTTAASWDVTYLGVVVASGKVLTVSNSLTLAGTDSTTMTFPTTSATVARIDAGQTFTGTQVFGALTATTINGNTITTGTGVLTLGAGKTLTASNSLTFAGTDSTTMTFPTTSATIARTDAANVGSLTTNSAAGGVGYATGAGGAVTQTSSRTSAVTLNNPTGAITLFAAAPVVGTWVSFTVNNSTVAATDVPHVSIKSSSNTYVPVVSAVAAGSFQISFESVAGTASDSPVISFAVMKGVIA